jgi:hypothetical protein
MDVIPKKLSQVFELNPRATALWEGSGKMGFGMVFLDDSTVPKECAPEDPKKAGEPRKMLGVNGNSGTRGPRARATLFCFMSGIL